MPTSYTSIIDNRDDNTLYRGLEQITPGGHELCIASAFFSLDALLMLADSICNYNRIRLLFGDDADVTQRRKLLERLKADSDADLLIQREQGHALLSPLQKVAAIFADHRFEARCYTAKKFHAKAYLMKRGAGHPPIQGILGSGNFTRSGLTRNIELNAHLSVEQAGHFEHWFDARWDEASEDVVTQEILTLIKRQTELYHPYVIYQKALNIWGDYLRGPGSAPSDLPLDPHQEQGFLQALRIIERENGVMVCDGVGLGKSFVGLALIEHFCREGNNVLLVAPKNILESGWYSYLDQYMKRFRQPFGNIHEMSVTDFGFDADDDPSDEPLASLAAKRRMRDDLMDRTDVVIIDEAHNFRTTAASRYKNLYRVLEQVRGRRKKVILLTATPINTAYSDLSAQLALISHDKGSLAGYSIGQIRTVTRSLDLEMKQARKAGNALAPGQLSLELGESNSETLSRVLESLLIQRSRKTCKAMAEAVGKPLIFPERHLCDPVGYEIGNESDRYRELINLAHRRFDPGVALLKQMREEVKKAEEKSQAPRPAKDIRRKLPGIKLAAFLTEQYRLEPVGGIKRYQDEVRLAGLVFTNALKQLESSPPAFQGIIQSLGEGLIARLQSVFGEVARDDIAIHVDWVRTPLFSKDNIASASAASQDIDDLISDGEALDAAGTETDDWLAQSVQERGLARKLREFTADKFDIERWRKDILDDLFFLQEIHQQIVRARTQPDPKLIEVAPKIAAEVAAGRRVLVFTQSQRTAYYLEQELREILKPANVARIDSRVEKTRQAILHAFSPGYNPPPVTHSPSVPKRVDVLISTDVLSEGVNLQEAGAILNYDIHWNPVRLIQRIGRVDRRLNPEITPDGHSFQIYNVFPPPEIDSILDLVGVIEDRTLRISQALGIEFQFFSNNVPADNLKEFNAKCDGEMTPADVALADYLRAITAPDPDVEKDLERVPPGAFGVWSNAPHDGLFALFTLEATGKATSNDRERFASELGHPILVLERPGFTPLTNAGQIFEILRGTIKGERSGLSSSEPDLNSRLQKLKTHVRQQFAEIELPRTILPKLVCWMELKKQEKH